MIYDSRMSQTKPIPVRLNQQVLERLDAVVENTGFDTRTEIIKLCLILFLDALEQNNYKLPGWNIDEMLKMMDGRTYRYSGEKPDLRMVAEGKREYKTTKKKRGR